MRGPVRVLCAMFGIAIALAFCSSGTTLQSAENASLHQAPIVALTQVLPAYAADDDDSGQGDGEGQEPEETAIDKAKRLIEALPADPGTITEEHRAAIEEAQEAYDALSKVEQAELDSIYLGKEQSYGRWLESAQWGLASRQPLDSTLSLIDGDYSAYVSSSSSMGKSTSARAKSWSVTELTVSGEQAWAVITCDSTSAFRMMRIGGADYTATVDGGVPSFTVPIAVNSDSPVPFLVAANNVSDYIAVQIAVSLPLVPASSDEVSTAKSKAQRTLSGLDNYTSESAAALKEAADALMAAASKSGVTSMEINNATKALDDALANAKEKEKEKKDDSSSDSSKKSKGSSGKSSKSSSSKSSASKSSASKSSSASAAKSSSAAAATRTTPTATNRTATTVPTVTTKKSSSSAASSKSSSSSSAAAAATGENSDGGQPSQDVVEVTPASTIDDQFITNAVIVMGVLALMLLGMCTRTFLFVRAKEVA